MNPMEKRKSIDYGALYKKALDTYPGSVFIIDRDADVLFANDEASKLVGLPKDEMMKMNHHEVVEKGICDSSAGLTVLETGQPQFKYITNTKGVNMYAISFPSYGADGGIDFVYTFTTTEDFTNQQLAEMNKRKRRLRELKENNYILTPGNDSIVANDPVMKRMYGIAERLAATDATIALLGESGTGKEVMANYIYRNSDRSNEEFIAVNCAAIPENLAEAEFFGYEKGAFTGAAKEGSLGIFEMANHGTIFLDEVGDLPLTLQTKLLRVLETGEIRRIGGNKTIKIDVRLIVATNQNLQKMVEAKEFREDLYYRLNAFPILIPPLREREGDIAPLAELYLQKYNDKYNSNKSFSEEALAKLKEYRWPGNVRELKNTVERIAFYTDGNLLQDVDIFGLSGSKLSEKSEEQEAFPPSKLLDTSMPLKEAMLQYEAQYIKAALEKNGGNVTVTANQLGVHRSGLYKKIQAMKEDGPGMSKNVK